MATMTPEVRGPSWPGSDELDTERFVVSFDRLSDTLFVHFFGRSLPAVSFPLDTDDTDYLYLLEEIETGRVVGIQIETFLSYALHRHPALVDLLDIAKLRGITPAEVAEIRRGLMVGGRRRATLAALLGVVDAEVAAAGAATPEPVGG